MNLPLFIARKISKRSSKSVTSVILRLAMAAVALSLAVMIISVCIFNGFSNEIRTKITGFSAHIQVTAADNNDSYEGLPVACSDSLKSTLLRNKEIISLHPYIYKAGIIRHGTDIEGIVLKGVNKNYDFSFFKNYLIEGKISSDKNKNEINNYAIISKTTADRLKLKCGDKMIVYFAAEQIMARPFFITGIFETGLDEFDKTFLITNIEILRKLNRWTEIYSSGVELWTKDSRNSEITAMQINNFLPPEISAYSVQQIYPQIFDWLSLVDTNVFIILSLMIGVAIISIITAVIVLIIERTRMIGLFKSFGATNGMVRKIFLYLASLLVFWGIIIGNFIGILFCYIQEKYKIIELQQESYYMKYVPIKFDWLEILYINVGTFAVCLIFILLPAMMISRVSPLKSIKYS